ncbi:MAG: class I SAM-dependent DNA methyltransferase [Sphingomonas bacterium]|nr:class I SAM-dependent DNA methyltransferase [Sphingomonas bacterium]
MTADDFITKWQASGGNERANTQLFLNDLCVLLGVQSPQPTVSDTLANDYVFERHVVKTEIDGTTSNGWIDCYRRDSFILEAKQGSAADIAAVESGAGDSLRDFFGQTAAERYKRGMAKRGTGQWTGAMQRAAGQAEGYAKALTAGHGWPPFLLVSDIGHCIDVYANFARDGRGYAPFPDRRRFRIQLDDLRDEAVRARLAAIWDAPLSLDPSAEAARVTREIAGLLATLARDIEARDHNPDRVAAFLMRLLFTMFAEDSGLIPHKSFSALLRKTRDRHDILPAQLTQMWQAMDTGGLAFGLGDAGETVRRFNGYLFKDTTAIELTPGEIDVLIAAAAADWRQVEPAIFGTLLERALNAKERAKLGAHYTPRAYVERLVGPTIMEPLLDDWLGARTAATEAAETGNREAARAIVETFHGRLAQTKVLDPACGTGNFLYVAMARMKELEGEVLELLQELGDDQYLAELSGHTITPENFLGIEINPRAAAIAQLVLWIGYLQWHFRVNGAERMPPDPVLRDVKTIENRDALITWDRRELDRDQYGRPVTRWDGETMKKQPVTGKDVPDDTARVELYRYINPRAAKWPTADFIIGNPPFIGAKFFRERLGDGYFEAMFRGSKMPESADLVMHWWDKAASAVRNHRTRRFGFVTTNSITQTFSRRVIAKHLDALDPISVAFAIPDHPWVSEKGDAAVRIAMTIGAPGTTDGRLLRVVDDRAAPDLIIFSETPGRIHSDLSIGAAVSSSGSLKSNEGIASPGVKLHGDGFIVTRDEARRLGLGTVPGTDALIRDYRNGRDLAARSRDVMVIDMFGLDEHEVRDGYPSIYSYLLAAVRPKREGQLAKSATADAKQYAEQWWLFGKPRPELRKALNGLKRYIATPVTAKHRVFTFLEAAVLPDDALIAIGLTNGWALGVLSSTIHHRWARSAGGTLEDRERYNKSRCFDPFPFPDPSDDALESRIREAAERLDALRKDVLARHDDLTLTKLYNGLEALRAAEAAGGVLSAKDRDIAERGCVSLIRQYHDTIDDLVADAYGWGDDWRSGALTDTVILDRLVALNKLRAAEEAQGKVRWLRPDFQAPGYVAPAHQETMALPEAVAVATVLAWPATLPDQVVAVAQVVERAGRPIAANDVARAFKGKNAKGVAPVLDALAGMGRLRKLANDRYAA